MDSRNQNFRMSYKNTGQFGLHNLPVFFLVGSSLARVETLVVRTWRFYDRLYIRFEMRT